MNDLLKQAHADIENQRLLGLSRPGANHNLDMLKVELHGVLRQRANSFNGFVAESANCFSAAYRTGLRSLASIHPAVAALVKLFTLVVQIFWEIVRCRFGHGVFERLIQSRKPLSHPSCGQHAP